MKSSWLQRSWLFTITLQMAATLKLRCDTSKCIAYHNFSLETSNDIYMRISKMLQVCCFPEILHKGSHNNMQSSSDIYLRIIMSYWKVSYFVQRSNCDIYDNLWCDSDVISTTYAVGISPIRNIYRFYNLYLNIKCYKKWAFCVCR